MDENLKDGTAPQRNYRFKRNSIDYLSDGEPVQSPLVRSYYKWWAEFGSKLPSIRDVRSPALDSLRDNMFIIEILPGERFLFADRGYMVNRILGTSNQGFTIETGDGSANNGNTELTWLAGYYQSLVEKRKCGHILGVLLSLQYMDIDYESLDSPVTNENGEINYIVGIIDTIPSNLLVNEK